MRETYDINTILNILATVEAFVIDELNEALKDITDSHDHLVAASAFRVVTDYLTGIVEHAND